MAGKFPKRSKFNRERDTSWQKVASWYDRSVGEKGHYYHEHVVIPGVLKLLNLHKGDSLLDLACGQGVLARHIRDVSYLGIDKSASLIAAAKQYHYSAKVDFEVGDVSGALNLPQKFTHAAVVLALQNIENAEKVIDNAAKVLEPRGKLVIVLNHPAFRIPRQSAWGIDEQNKQQYRKIFRYLSELNLPITMNPGNKSKQDVTWSFHHPLSYYFQVLKDHGFVVTDFEEWASDKTSVGKAAKMENRSREEIPLFAVIAAELK